jgi:hypothetical protein
LLASRSQPVLPWSIDFLGLSLLNLHCLLHHQNFHSPFDFKLFGLKQHLFSLPFNFANTARSCSSLHQMLALTLIKPKQIVNPSCSRHFHDSSLDHLYYSHRLNQIPEKTRQGRVGHQGLGVAKYWKIYHLFTEISHLQVLKPKLDD